MNSSERELRQRIASSEDILAMRRNAIYLETCEAGTALRQYLAPTRRLYCAAPVFIGIAAFLMLLRRSRANPSQAHADAIRRGTTSQQSTPHGRTGPAVLMPPMQQFLLLQVQTVLASLAAGLIARLTRGSSHMPPFDGTGDRC